MHIKKAFRETILKNKQNLALSIKIIDGKRKISFSRIIREYCDTKSFIVMKRKNLFFNVGAVVMLMAMAILVLAACEPRPRTAASFEAERQQLATDIQREIDNLDATVETLNSRIEEENMTRETENTYREAVNDLRERRNDLQAELMRVQATNQDDWVRVRRDVRRTLDNIGNEIEDITADIEREVERTF
jgi:hypothetical protein